MKDFLKINLIGFVIVNATFIPLWILKSIITQSFDIKIGLVVYFSMIVCSFLGVVINYIISPILDKIANL